jgi:hypothetical protein
MQLLADKMIALQVVEQPISDELVRGVLKKMTASRGSKSSGASRR